MTVTTNELSARKGNSIQVADIPSPITFYCLGFHIPVDESITQWISQRIPKIISQKPQNNHEILLL